ncbi:hypothetical protein G6F46_012375 [Rhizopus delemar]|uniref:Uncharacterized protein n=2 Tax=Rhizopus TaxID=4842 RepID=A0A9P7CJG8_9FUNG|nr:hypothetical protein G6F55_008612 [Rhizopus delemar]KAG1533610.1 hypothetical protein G6F51_012526 [Rhizopus arrhizus]KAG1487808.1 hypothetical protein G6F54_012434 [Rhizopus delemar]KAG1495694.1 hypothetical protein G6F53_012323 [Rhizopus delemar]KAG1519604.1 hypothetical protein G6F52_008461 [Rhizopus delemar]
MEDIQICYLESPNEPILVCNARVFGAPNLYKNYKSREDLEEKCEEDDMDKNISFGESESNLVAEILINNKIENEAQIVEFINYVYRPKSEHVTDSPFKLTNVSDKTVLGVLWKYTERFNKTTALGFNQWLKKQNIDFLIQEPERKVLKIQGSETKKLRIRILSVLDSQFHDEVADNIVSTIPRHHAYIKQLKDDGYEVIGSAKQALSKRDLSDQDILSSLDQIHGNTQDFLTYVKEKKTKICVVAIDYAGFTTNMSDLKNLLK